MSRPRGIGFIRKILFNMLSGKSKARGELRDQIFGPVRSAIDASKLLPGSQALTSERLLKPIAPDGQASTIGKDYLGNVYYELPPDPFKNRTKFKRWYFPGHDDDWDRPIPPEWESWLRYRRPDPPTEDEINRNIAIAQLKKIRAKENEEKRASEAVIAASDEVERKEQVEGHKDKLGEKPEKDPEPDVITGLYPVRRDMETSPGSTLRARKKDPMYDQSD